ncbi:MAG: aminotransferase class I/II-fold pyridoxal phosphate-dependent enzyme [Lachnospiraceae bacterium]|nr:aminotransferase class I/II-fold pyridoxal phosphate-dependent enzyme [Lachnospiraceae bacterium]
MGSLFDEIKKLSGGSYPFHMPGHKREALGNGAFFEALYGVDLTEITGSDDLHKPEGIIKEAMDRAAALYGSGDTFFLINGSTAGILAGISAALDPGKSLLMMRGSHMSAYHAAVLRHLKVNYIYGEIGTVSGAAMGVNSDEVESALERYPETGAVFITSPTYEGYSSDLRTIADAVHKRNIPLIVDAAHGAHFGFSPLFPESAVQAGADIVIMSLHKTLPSLTQTALLHLNGNLVPKERIQKYLTVYQSSSPSYILMAAIDECVRLVSEMKESDWDDFINRRREMSKKLSGLKHIRIEDHFSFGDISPKAKIPEPGKMIVMPENRRDGVSLAKYLRSRYRIESELAVPAYLLLILTICDSEKNFEILCDALQRADEEYTEWMTDKEAVPAGSRKLQVEPAVMEMWEAFDAKGEPVEGEQALGRISASFVTVYPPGRPAVVPGERISREALEEIKNAGAAGCEIRGHLSAIVE